MIARTGSVKHVTSTANPIIKAVRALHQRKSRAESGLFLAEGHKLVLDALAVGWQPEMIITLEPEGDTPVAKLAARVRASGGDVVFTTPSVMEKLARRDNPQTVMGVFEQRLAPLDAMRGGTILALEAPRDPGNVGTIIRTADAAGAAGVILVGASADPFGVEAVRATMGSIFHMPLARADDAAFAQFLKRWPGKVYGTHLDGAVDIRTIEASEPQLLVMGTEQSGLTDEMAARCDALLKIPMAGQADSFNLAIATAIALYEIRRPFL
ncbi:RNA methyltransferase [Acuticoccus sp. M5D2P5]|uniref:TrmH family RNA methyltransferase n=1 Tax=Acuticoccus kalidii TaxID=2910977 RepID=UPI001F1B9C9F|nr:RNA methyltransferase [Acuticoccus kalidii]MCF3935946.1 RNA methyltransferase [Acuticoccus kalidii]